MLTFIETISDGSCEGECIFRLSGLGASINSLYIQHHSFEYPLVVPELGSDTPYNAIFIRAPAIISWGEGVKVLATVKAHPAGEGRDIDAGLSATVDKEIAVAVLQDGILGTSFHPELTSDNRWHQYFVRLVTDSLK